MKVTSCLLINADPQFIRVAESAIRSAFPQASIAALDTTEEAFERPEVIGAELLVLTDPDKALLTRVLAANDSSGLRRWAIVIVGTAPAADFINVVRPGEWDEEHVAQEFRAAVDRCELIRENARLKGDLLTIASRVSHDLRSPLGAIINAGELLKEIASASDPTSLAIAKPLFDSVDDLGKLITQISQFTKASAVSVLKQQLSMEEILWLVLQRHEREILRKRATIAQPDDWPKVRGVASWLEAIWGNLISNSLEHGSEGNQITLGWERRENDLRFRVTDTGPGVAAEKAADLFQPFNLLHRLNAREGLGLSIVQRLVELQGGTCSYSPGQGGGSTFYFTLPTEIKSDSITASPSKRQAAVSKTAEKGGK